MRNVVCIKRQAYKLHGLIEAVPRSNLMKSRLNLTFGDLEQVDEVVHSATLGRLSVRMSSYSYSKWEPRIAASLYTVPYTSRYCNTTKATSIKQKIRNDANA